LYVHVCIYTFSIFSQNLRSCTHELVQVLFVFSSFVRYSSPPLIFFFLTYIICSYVSYIVCSYV